MNHHYNQLISPSQVPAAFFTAAVPHAYAVLSSRVHYDNANPRNHSQSVTKSDILDKVVTSPSSSLHTL
jgi:hypothetical protein